MWISAFLNILHLLVDMNKMISFHIILDIKTVSTDTRFIWFLSSIVCILSCQHFFHLAEKQISAFLNILHLLVDMNKMMSFHIILGIKTVSTDITFIWFLSSMYFLSTFLLLG